MRAQDVCTALACAALTVSLETTRTRGGKEWANFDSGRQTFLIAATLGRQEGTDPQAITHFTRLAKQSVSSLCMGRLR